MATFNKRTCCLCGVETIPFITQLFQGLCAIILLAISLSLWTPLENRWGKTITQPPITLSTFNNNTLTVSFSRKHSPHMQTLLLRKQIHCWRQSREIKDRGQGILEIGKQPSPPFERVLAMKICNINKAGDALKAKAFLPGPVLCGGKRPLLSPCS